ncbi:MAG: phosphatase PAP2 family protein [Rhizomicrobium sp.]|nr:phosphatase PAP2 family protein [Rhizomicrobium sp.]
MKWALGQTAFGVVLACATILVPAQAKMTESAGTGVAIALPVVAGGITLLKNDREGSFQLAVTTALTVGTAYGLKHLIHECRPFAKPCGPGSNNWDSFPSDTAALAFAPAQFLWQRYGWEYGVPAYAAAGFVAWSRVDAKKHNWGDVAASAGISLLYNELLTTRFRKHSGLSTNLQAGPHEVYGSVNYSW